MKKSFTILILSVMTYFFPGWNRIIAQEPPEFTSSMVYNPVLYYGYTGLFDEFSLLQPSVLVHEGTFYMFYTGMDGDGIASIGLASSTDGYSYEKYQGSPVLVHSENGFDALEVSGATVIEVDTGWIMYYGGRESGWGPPPFVGRATAPEISGPWTRSLLPVLTIGSPDEWDNDFISPFQIISMDGGGYMMFYTGGNYASGINYQIGMATSPDGLVWTKYDDPLTVEAPYAESDPVLKVGDANDWDERFLWGGSVLKNPSFGYEMYYSGGDMGYVLGFGYATSPDGIVWTKYSANPFYTIDDDPYAQENGFGMIVRPYIVYNDLTAFMYYDYGIPGVIAMATAELTGIGDQVAVSGQQSEVGVYPNPTDGIAHFALRISQYQNLTLKVYDAQGREVGSVYEGSLPAGEHTVSFDMSGLPAGLNFYRLSAIPASAGTSGRGLTASGKIVKY
jgi:hypothetical protein